VSNTDGERSQDMPVLRQMPELFLRGALANQTMRNLTSEQKEHAGELVKMIVNHPEMTGHKTEFITALAVTIGADYRNDRSIAEEEFYLAVWRGVIQLFYHRSYSYECNSCNEVEYITKRGKPKAMDRQYPVCPNCSSVKIKSQGDSKWKPGKFVNYGEFQESYKYFTPDMQSPEFITPIKVILGEKRYANPEMIINDKIQLKKFFGEFVWNYYRQQISENKRKEHNQTPKEIYGPADEITVELVISLCNKYKISYTYYKEMNPENGWYQIGIRVLQTTPPFSIALIDIVNQSKKHNVEIQIDALSIKIKSNSLSPLIGTTISKPEHVLYTDGVYDSETSSNELAINQTCRNFTGGNAMDYDNHEVTIETKDNVEHVRSMLPDGHCKQIFDIFTERGDNYHKFSAPKLLPGEKPMRGQTYGYGDGIAKNAHIAKFLGISPRAVNQHKEIIKHVMLAHGMVPE
jgi:hypothetical protein